MELYPHEPIHVVDDRLYVVEGRWRKSPMERKMTVFALPDGTLAVHSAIAMDEDGMASIESFGRPAWILVPNIFHASEAGWYAKRYPSARVLVPEEVRAKLFEKISRIDGSLDGHWPEELAGDLAVIPLRGTRIGETAFVHRPSRTLVLTDACFHYRDSDLTAFWRLLMSLNGAFDRFGPSRIFRHIALKDRRAFAASVETLLTHDFDRVIVSHGRTIETGGREAMREAFGWSLGR